MLDVLEQNFYKFGSVHFWYVIHPKKLQNLKRKKKRSKDSMRSTVTGFYSRFKMSNKISSVNYSMM
jgi:hypothetical protein